MVNNIGPRPIGTAIIAIAVAAILLTAACSDETPTVSSDSEEAADQSPTAEVFAPTPSPTPTARPTPPPGFSTEQEPDSPAVPSRPPCHTSDSTESPGNVGPAVRIGHTSSILGDGGIILGGGWYAETAPLTFSRTRLHPTIEIYDPASDEWCIINVPERARFKSSAIALENGKILIVGLDGARPWPDRPPYALVFDPYTLSFEEVGPPTALRSLPTLTLLRDGRVLSVGGLQEAPDDETASERFSTDVEIYDPETDSWEKRHPITAQPASSFGRNLELFSEPWLFATLDGNAVMVREGDIGEERNRLLVEVYNVTADTWTTIADVSHYGDRPQQAYLDSANSLYIFYDYFVEVLDLGTRRWSYSYSPWLLQLYAGITELPDGRIMVSGGATQRLGKATARTVIFDPSTMSWTGGPELRQPRLGHSALPASDGSLIILGGLINSIDNEDHLHWNTLELLSPRQLSAIGTNPRPDMLDPLMSPWPRCITVPDFERPPSAATQPSEFSTSPRDSYEMSEKAMDHVSSYTYEAVATQILLNKFAGSPFKSAECNVWHSEYEDIENHRTWILTAEDRLDVLVQSVIKSAGTLFERDFGDGSWREVIYRAWEVPRWADFDQTLHSTAWEDIAPEELAESSIEGIDTVDGVEAYRLEVYFTSGSREYQVNYWIGIHDSLLRLVHARSHFENTEGLQTADIVIINFHSFNENFNIQPPPEDQIAE